MKKTISLGKLKKMLSGPNAYEKLEQRSDKYLGSGAQRSAYLIGGYVVKANTGAWNMRDFDRSFRDKYDRVPAKKLRRLGIKPPRVWYAGPGREFVIMPYYGTGRSVPDTRPHAWSGYTTEVKLKFYKRFKEDHISPRWQVAPGVTIFLDVHDQNVGLRADGKIVAFDW